MILINHQAPAAFWAWQHFGHNGLKDARLQKRSVQIAANMAANPRVSITAQQMEWSQIKAAYQFFANPNVQPHQLQARHLSLIHDAISQPGEYLLIEDTSEFSWSGLESIDGLGPVGAGKPGAQGFHLHSVLAAKWPPELPTPTQSKRPPLQILGLAHQEFYIRKPIPKGEQRSRSFKSTARPRESQLWTRASFHLKSPPKGCKWVRICDRGADIYEFLRSCEKFGHEYVVRGSRQRALLDPQTGKKTNAKLFDTVRQTDTTLGSLSLPLRSRQKIAARQAELAISCVPVLMRSPQRKGNPIGTLPPLSCHVIWVRELDPPQGVKPVEWFLLCSEKIETFSQACTKVLQYASRWIIEEYHKALKTGMRAEKLQMDRAHQLFAAIAMKAIVALRLLDLREALRFQAEDAAEKSGLTSVELKLLRLKAKAPCRTVAETGLAIGKLGGHIGRKSDGMPGWQTLFLGMSELHWMAEGVALWTSINE